MRKFIFLLFTFFTSIFLLTNCDQDDTINYVDNKPSGEELFKAIFFLEGDLAKRISYYQPILAQMDEFEKKHPEIIKSKSQKINYFIELIKKNDNAYFNNLKNSIESKDVKKVESSILQGGDLIKAVAIIDYSKMNSSDVLDKYDFSNKNDLKTFLKNNEKTYEKLLNDDENSIQNINPNKEACLFPYAVVAAVVWEAAAAVNVVAIATAVAITKAAFWDPTESVEANSKNSLEKDIFLKKLLLI